MSIFTNVPRKNWLRAIFEPRTTILLGVLGLCQPALSQEVSVVLLQPAAIQPAAIQPAAIQPAAIQPAAMAPTPMVMAIQPAPLPEAPSHRFWDGENSLLFATSAAFSAADFVVTRDNLRSGGQELNPVTRVFSGSTTGLAVNFAGETAGVVALSYFFHKTGHHKLERAVSMVNIASSAAAVTFDLAHR
jgi:hypothetical protein